MIYQKIRDAVERIQSFAAGNQVIGTPEIGVILGSGFASVPTTLGVTAAIPCADIPHFHPANSEGLAGTLFLGSVAGVSTVFLHGRLHLYEGLSMEDVVFPTRVLSGLGVKTLILTNAAGAINSRFRPGDFMVIQDHLNLMFDNPLTGPDAARLGPRFPDMSEPYSPECSQVLQAEAAALGLRVHQGVYAGVLGPTYETPAEVRMLRVLGADAVGMSTIPESIAANHLGVRVAGLSCITNFAAGMSTRKLNHDDHLNLSRGVSDHLAQILLKSLPKLVYE